MNTFTAGMRTFRRLVPFHAVLMFGLVFGLVFGLLFTACGTARTPAEEVALRFFAAVNDEDPAQLRALLEEETRTEFEAGMGDAELASYLRDANETLRARYGSLWHARIRVVASSAGTPREDGTPWTVRVSVGEGDEGEQTLPLLETTEGFWLDLQME